MRLLLFVFLLVPAFGQEFEVVSVKPDKSGSNHSSTHSDRGRLTATNVTMRMLITMAYGIRDYQLEGPDWLSDERYDVSAKFPEALPPNNEKYDAAFQGMMQKMLGERFKLQAHRGSKDFSVYALVVDKRGIKFKEVADSGSHHSNSDNTHYKGSCVSMDTFANFLARRADLPVLDKTDLKGYYDLELSWEPPPQDPSTPAGLSMEDAVKEQLGLKLERRKAPIGIVIVDHIEKVPTEN